MPPNTVSVTRPGKFGNPFSTAAEFARAIEHCESLRHTPDWMEFEKGQRVLRMIEHIDQLRGMNLACYCRLDKPCHGDVFANRPHDFERSESD